MRRICHPSAIRPQNVKFPSIYDCKLNFTVYDLATINKGIVMDAITTSVPDCAGGQAALLPLPLQLQRPDHLLGDALKAVDPSCVAWAEDVGADGAVLFRDERRVARTEARIALGVAADASLVVGWAGPLDHRSGILDLIEAAAICDDGVVLVVPVRTGHEQVVDQADARELLHRVRFTPAAPPGRPGPAGFDAFAATAFAAVDVLLVPPPRHRAEWGYFEAANAWAEANAVPCIRLGASRPAQANALVGWTSWTIRAGDSGLLARLLGVIAARPDLLDAAIRSIARGPRDPQRTAHPAAPVGRLIVEPVRTGKMTDLQSWRTVVRRAVYGA
jgi:hypothetical protein